MQKALVVSFFLVLISQSIHAQTGFGVKAGYNLSSMKTDGTDFYETNYRHGYNIGLFIITPVKENFSVESNVMFSTAGGWAYTLDSAYTVGMAAVENFRDRYYTINYIAIPIVGKYTFGPVNVHAGPQISLLGRALVEDHHRNVRTYVDSTFNLRKDREEFVKIKDVQQFYKLVDFGLVGGIGCEIDRFYFSARYYLGLTNATTQGDAVRHRYIQASVGIRLSNDY